jgi:hypothetical protein
VIIEITINANLSNKNIRRSTGTVAISIPHNSISPYTWQLNYICHVVFPITPSAVSLGPLHRSCTTYPHHNSTNGNTRCNCAHHDKPIIISSNHMLGRNASVYRLKPNCPLKGVIRIEFHHQQFCFSCGTSRCVCDCCQYGIAAIATFH